METVNYQKIIQTGQYIEIYEYEKSPITGRRKKKQLYSVDKKKIRRVDNVYRQRKSFKRLIRANFEGSESPILITLTHRDIVDLPTGYKNYNLFIKRLRYIFTQDFRYITVPEFQKRGSIHFHGLIWGLPESSYKNERKTRKIASIWRHGFIDIRPTDGSLKLIGYLSKYMSKSLLEGNLGGKKAYTASRNIKRPVIHKNSVIYNYTEDIWGINLSTTPPLQEKVFSTEWLGLAHYKLYKIDNDKIREEGQNTISRLQTLRL